MNPDETDRRTQATSERSNVDRPLWSVMIPTYNDSGYLEQAIESVLRQAPPPERMQIEVIDDCSTTGDPAEIVRRIGRGRIGFWRQTSNKGHVRNFTTCVERARGHLIHILHADDLVLPDFYRVMEEVFEEERHIGAAFCRHIVMDPYGEWLSISPPLQHTSGLLRSAREVLASEQRIQFAAIVVRSETYEHVGPFDTRFECCAEDWEMWVRIAARYPVWYESKPLALYRWGHESLTGRGKESGQNIRDVQNAIEMFADHLPPGNVRSIQRRARAAYAAWVLEDARRQRLLPGALLRRIRDALLLSRGLRVWLALIRLLLSLRRAG